MKRISIISIIICSVATLSAQLPADTPERRITLDFNKTINDILPSLQLYFPEVDDAMITNWEESKALEYTIIDDEKRYFRNAVANLFRIDTLARQRKEQVVGRERASRDYIVSRHIREVLLAKKSTSHLYSPHRWHFCYSITLDSSIGLDSGETIHLWLPYPSNLISRQTDICLIHHNLPYTINQGSHCTAYTKLSHNPTNISRADICYTFATFAEHHTLPQHFKHKVVNTSSPTLAPYLVERTPHIVFTPDVKALADSIVGYETRPYYQARLLFEAMRTLYPWASAREYSTIPNIPQYVIDNRHGDCGQITLLYITLCRYKAIPARWQSGFMLHPGYENLHDWAEIYIEGMGWIPVDPSFGVQHWGKTEAERYFYFGGIDAFRLIINTDFSQPLTPQKQHPRSEPIDFQRGEVETNKQNLYFDTWHWNMNVIPIIE